MSRSLPTSRAPREAEDRPVAGGAGGDVAWIHRNDDLPSVGLAPGQREEGRRDAGGGSWCSELRGWIDGGRWVCAPGVRRSLAAGAARRTRALSPRRIRGSGHRAVGALADHRHAGLRHRGREGAWIS
jgi:hypothetical protein